jgi:polysaccharide biosynthesis PFTS motif protein
MIKFRPNNFKIIRKQLKGFDFITPKTFFENIRDKLTITNLNINNTYPIVNDCETNEIIIRQYLLHSCIGYLTTNILGYFGDNKINKKLSIALPKQWLNIISKEGAVINFIFSNFKWFLKILIIFLYNEFFLIKLIIRSFINFLFYLDRKNFSEDYVYFLGLNNSNFANKIEESNGIISFLNNNYFKKNYNKIFHDYSKIDNYNQKNIEISYAPIFLQYPRLSLIKIIFWALKNIIFQFLLLLKFDWPNILLLKEISVSAKMSFQDKKYVAKKYLFHNSSWTYRPVWTYQAEKLGSSIELYFYSTNIVPFNSNEIKGLPYYGYKSMNWPFYIFWDQFQANFIDNITNRNNKYKILGPINFTNQNKFFHNKKKKTIAVFDVQPLRDTVYKLSGGIALNYYTITNCTYFITDIYELCNTKDFEILYKKKRNVGKKINFEYRRLINKLSENNNFINIDEHASLSDIFHYSDAVICQPFTSVAIAAKYYNKEIIYYESFDILRADDFSKHGIELIKNKSNLNNWLDTIIK